MIAEEIKKDIYWVGARDWNLREFHGYDIPRGTSYNAYVIMDEKITLVDTVKATHVDELLMRIKSIVDPFKIEYVVCNHVEMDHSGGIPEIMRLAPNATVVTDIQGKNALQEHYDTSKWTIQVVKTGDQLNIGKRNLTFVQTPMLHWPDSMVTYAIEDKVLLSNDGFGQHIASDNIFAEGDMLDIVFEEAKKYYANILFPYSMQANKALGDIEDLDIEMIATGHGCIWRGKELIDRVKAQYTKWARAENDGKAVIIYDTMWHSTETLAKAVQQEFEANGIPTVFRSLQANPNSNLVTDIVDSKYVVIGSPTLNNQLLPTVAGFITYMRGLAPKKKVGFAFGSYGWNSGIVERDIQSVFTELGWEAPLSPYCEKYVPCIDNTGEIKAKVRELIEKTK